jgi:hypothetical protein
MYRSAVAHLYTCTLTLRVRDVDNLVEELLHRLRVVAGKEQRQQGCHLLNQPLPTRVALSCGRVRGGDERADNVQQKV